MVSAGFTGSRGDPGHAQFAALQQLIESEASDWHAFHHGSCTGFDLAAHHLIQGYQHVKIHVWPPLNRQYKAYCVGDVNHTPMGYAQRNLMIVQHADILVACPPGPEADWPRSGTWQTVRIARRLGVPIYVINFDGNISGG